MKGIIVDSQIPYRTNCVLVKINSMERYGINKLIGKRAKFVLHRIPYEGKVVGVRGNDKLTVKLDKKIRDVIELLATPVTIGS